MTDQDNITELDISEVDDTEQYFNSENPSNEPFDSEINNIQNTEDFNTEEQLVSEKKTPNAKSEVTRSTKLPMARIKNIMKMDPDVSIVSADAVFLVTKATELFLETMAKETFTYTATGKRKTIAKKGFRSCY